MVDFVTAVGAASAVLSLTTEAWKLGKTLHALYKDTQEVDETVNHLATETTTLGDTSNLVHEQLEDVVKATKPGGTSESAYDKDGRLWACVGTEVTQCRATLSGLRGIVQSVREEGSHFIAQAQRQMKLNKSKGEILSIRQRIRTHTTGLQTILQVINIKVSHLAPGHATAELKPKLDGLRVQIQRMQDTLEEFKKQGVSPDAGNALVDCARDVMRSGCTLYEASVADGSVTGGAVGADSNNRVASWVGTLESLHHTRLPDRSGANSYAPSVFSDDNRNATTSGEAPFPAQGEDAQDGYDSDEDDFKISMAKAALEEGAQAFDERQWGEADALLQEALSMLQHLPMRSSPLCDTLELQYKLAVCAYHLHEPIIAEEALLSLVRQMPRNDKQRGIVCDARFLLARYYIRLHKLDLAKSSCDSASNGRRRLLGKADDSYLETLALSSRIYQLLQNPAMARIARSMIPEPRRDATLAAVDTLLEADTALQAAVDIPSGVGYLIQPGQADRDDKRPTLEASPDSALSIPSRSTFLHPNEASEFARAQSEPTIASGPLQDRASRSAALTGRPASVSPTSPLTSEPVAVPHSRREVTTQATAPTFYQTLPPPLQDVQAMLARRNPPGVDNISSVSPTSQHHQRHSSVDARSAYGRDENTIDHFSMRLRPPAAPSTPSDPRSEAGHSTTLTYGEEQSDLIIRYHDTQQPDDDVNSIYPATVLEDEVMGVPSLGDPAIRTVNLGKTDRQQFLLHFCLNPKTELERLICNGKLKAAIKLLQATPEVYVPQDPLRPNEALAVHFAIIFGDLDIVRMLISQGFPRGCNLGPRGAPVFFSPVNLAVSAHRTDILQLLIRAGASVEDALAEHCISWKWLYLTKCNSSQSVVSTFQCLLDNGWKLKDGATKLLCQTIQIGSAHGFLRKPLVKFLLHAGAEVLPSALPKEDELGYPSYDVPLFAAVLELRDDIVRMLLQQRPQQQLLTRNNVGTYPLACAVSKALYLPASGLHLGRVSSSSRSRAMRSLDMTRALLEAGADVHAKCAITYVKWKSHEVTEMTTPLALAVSQGSNRKELVALLKAFDPRSRADSCVQTDRSSSTGGRLMPNRLSQSTRSLSPA